MKNYNLPIYITIAIKILILIYLNSYYSFANNKQLIIKDNFINNHIERFIKFPGSDIVAVESEGILYIMTNNGRYIITGTIYDSWLQKNINNIADLEQFNSIDNINRIIKLLDNHQYIRFGTGNIPLIIFADPNCSYCHKLVKDLITNQDKYKILLVALPFLGKNSIENSILLNCNINKSKALDSFINNNYNNLVNDKCDKTSLQQGLIIANMLGIKNVPFIINQYGKTHEGIPDQLNKFLQSK